MAKKFWKSAPSNWKEQAELNDRLRQQQMEEEAFGADTPSTVSQMLRTGRVLPSQPAQQMPKFQGPSPTPGGRGQPQAPVVTKAHEGTGRLVNGIWVPDEGEVDWEKESAIPPRKSPLEYAVGAVGNTFGSLLRTPGEIARGVPRGAVRQILESINASNPAVASRLAELTNIDPGLRPGTAPAGAGEQAGQLLTSLGGFAGPAISPEEMAKNPLIGLGPEAQIAGDIAFKAAGPAARQAVQGVKGYPKKLVETAPRLVPERQAMGMAKKAPKAEQLAKLRAEQWAEYGSPGGISYARAVELAGDTAPSFNTATQYFEKLTPIEQVTALRLKEQSLADALTKRKQQWAGTTSVGRKRLQEDIRIFSNNLEAIKKRLSPEAERLSEVRQAPKPSPVAQAPVPPAAKAGPTEKGLRSSKEAMDQYAVKKLDTWDDATKQQFETAWAKGDDDTVNRLTADLTVKDAYTREETLSSLGNAIIEQRHGWIDTAQIPITLNKETRTLTQIALDNEKKWRGSYSAGWDNGRAYVVADKGHKVPELAELVDEGILGVSRENSGDIRVGTLIPGRFARDAKGNVAQTFEVIDIEQSRRAAKGAAVLPTQANLGKAGSELSALRTSVARLKGSANASDMELRKYANDVSAFVQTWMPDKSNQLKAMQDSLNSGDKAQFIIDAESFLQQGHLLTDTWKSMVKGELKAKPAAESVGAKGAAPTVPPSQARAPQVMPTRIPDEAPSIEGVGFPERETPLTVEGAGEGAMPFGPAAAKPPTVPPTTGAVPPARGPKPQNVPQGVTDTLAQAAAIVERDRPGGITRLVDRLPGLRQVQRALHPSVGMPEHIIKAHIGGGHAEAVVSNRLRAEVTQTVKQLDTAFGRGATSGKGKNLAAFTGPAEKKVPFSGTLYDIMQRPDMYDLTAEQRQLLTAIHAGRSESFNAVKSYYGLKVREFPVPEGAVHLGNVDKTKGALEMAGSEQAAVRRGAAKERFYDTGADRYLHDKAKFPDNPDKWFTPVTDVAALMSRRADQELVTEAGQSVFKAGLGGKTRLEVLQEIDPGLANKMLGLKNRLAKLKGYGKILRDKQAEAIDDFLSGAMEDADLASLHSDLDVKLEPGRYVAKSQAGRTLADVQQEIDSVKAAIAELRPGWRTAKTNPYVMVTEGNLYQYYPASEAPIIRRLTERSNSATLRAFDNLRATAFGGDLSPASIQGVNSMLLDPLRTGRVLFEVGPKRLFSEAAMAADVRANPESWALFTRATGLDPLIGPGAEYTTGFLGKIPKVGKYWNRFNETVYRPTQWAMKKSFDSIYADGVKMGLTSEQAAAIAADDVTKLIPNYSYRRMGMSQAQAAKYRAVLTSVSFLTQPAALMSDATEGILKMGTLQTLSPSEAYAVKRVLTLVAATETIAVVSNAYYASQNGKDVGQAIKESVSPTSGYFMSAVLPNGSRIGLGGPFRSIIKAVWPAEVKGLPAPVPFAGIVRFARAKVSPALSIVLDLSRNQDYFGQKIMQGDFPINALQGLEYAVEGAAPLTIGSAMEQVRRGTPEDIPSQMGSQFLGVNLVDEAPPSVWKAAEETNKVFRKLPFMSKYDINLGSIGSTFDKIVMTPEQRIVRQNTMGAVVTPRMKTFVESPSFAKMKPDDQKVAIDKEMDRIKGMLTKVYNAYGKGEPAPDLTGKMAPTIKDLPIAEVEKHVLEIESLKPYLDIPDQVMAQMGNRKVKLDSGGFTTIKMYMELTDQLDQQAEDAAKAGDLVARDKYLVAAKARKVGNVYKAVSAEVTRLKNEYRKAHPEADALLYTWYGLTPKWKYQQKATPQPVVPKPVVPTQSLATAGTLAR